MSTEKENRTHFPRRRSRREIKKMKKNIITAAALVFVAVTVAVIGITVVKYGKKITVIYMNGTELGYTTAEGVSEMTDAFDAVYDGILIDFGEEYTRPIIETEKRLLIFGKSDISPIFPEDALRLVAEQDGRLELSYAVKVDGVYIADVASPSSAENAVARIETELSDIIRLADKSITAVRGDTDITMSERLCPADMIQTEDDLYKLFCGEYGATENHPAVKEITQKLGKIAGYTKEADAYYEGVVAAFGVATLLGEEEKADEEIAVTPPQAEEMRDAAAEASDGTEVTNPCELISFIVTTYEKFYESIEYEIEKIEKPERFEGYSFVSEKGEYGVRIAEYSVEYSSDGMTRTLLDEQRLLLPKKETVYVGTCPLDEPGTVTGSFVWPIETEGMLVSSLFEDYREPFDEKTGYHLGMDIQGYENDPIWASDGGVVTFAGLKDSYGNLVIIDHGNGFVSYYAHMSSIRVEKDQKVSQGQIIGHVGMSGVATNFHLHFELHRNGEIIDPLSLLPEIELHYW